MEKEELINYGYYNDIGEYCVVLDLNRLKMLYKADKIYLETEEE